MNLCYCRIILAALVIVFAWIPGTWANIVLTIIGALLFILALKRDFCCCRKKAEISTSPPKEGGE